MDRVTRHDLKTDKFVEEVGQTVSFLEEHRQQAIRYGAIALAVVVAAAGTYYYLQSRGAERQQALHQAVATYNARVTPDTREGQRTFPTDAEKDKAIDKELGGLMTKYSGSDEAVVATYLMGVHAADKGKMADAARYLKQASEGGNKDYSSLAKLSLADIYAADGKTADAEKLLRDVMANPTVLVTKEQATLNLARILAKNKPEEARKLLEPLRTVSGAVSRSAIQALTDLGLAK